MPHYDKEWKDWARRMPKLDPRGIHHRETCPDPDFVLLCEAAANLGAHVELDVSGNLFGDRPFEYRNLTALHLVREDEEGHTWRGTLVFHVGESVGHAARRARGLLEEAA